VGRESAAAAGQAAARFTCTLTVFMLPSQEGQLVCRCVQASPVRRAAPLLQVFLVCAV